MSPTEHTQGKKTGDYRSDKHRMLHEKDLETILSIKPDRMETAQAWVKTASEVGAKQEVIDHFVDEIRRLR